MLTKTQRRRFWRYVDMSGECWLWTGRDLTRWGYARFFISKKPLVRLYVHRVSWLIAYGELDDGQIVHHLCGNKLCVNPEHLSAMPQGEHTRLHGWGIKGGRCKHGHPFTLDNIHVKPDGRRRCLTCRRIQGREQQRRRRLRAREVV